MKDKIINIKYSGDKVEKVVSGRIRTINGDKLAEMELLYERALLGISEDVDKVLNPPKR